MAGTSVGPEFRWFRQFDAFPGRTTLVAYHPDAAGTRRPPLPPVGGMFRQVTDIAWDSAGNGYINSRIAGVAADGQWPGSFGSPDFDPGPL